MVKLKENKQEKEMYTNKQYGNTKRYTTETDEERNGHKHTKGQPESEAKETDKTLFASSYLKLNA